MVICFTLRARWPPGELEEDKGETEEPKVYPCEQFEFHWALTRLEEGGAPVLDEVKAQGLLSQASTSLSIFSGFVSTLIICFLETRSRLLEG